MSYGHIKLYRSLLDSKVFANEKSLKIWIWLLLKATFEKRFVSIVIGKGKHTVELMPGELIFGRFQAEEALCIDGSTIYKKLKEFEQEEMIMITSNSHYSIITICNWDIYQSIINEEVATNELPSNSQVATNELPSNSQVATNELPSNTNKKDNKVNKEKKVNKVFIPPTQIEVENYFAENGYSKESAVNAFKYYDISGWVDSRGAKVRNWKQKMLSVWFKEENRITKEQAKIDREEWVRQQGKGVTYEQMERRPQ